MELRISPIRNQAPVSFNYEELKSAITEKAALYANMVYTDETIADAKADRAALNKLKKALNDERIAREKEYLKPFNDFKNQIAELVKIIDEPVGIIDRQIKAADDAKKAEKREKIIAYFNGLDKPDELKIDVIWSEKWLNASVSSKAIAAEIAAAISKANADAETLLNTVHSHEFEAFEVYWKTLDLNAAIAEAQRLDAMEKRKEEWGIQQEMKLTSAEPVPVPEEPTPTPSTPKNAQWVAFKCLLTRDDAIALKEFFNARQIEFERI